jgi:FKBP-type peptidyl-prolyl cis-trans isomerase FkpA
MKRCWSILVLAILIGCGEPPKPPLPPPPPKDHVRIEPGPADPDAPTEFTTTESGLKYRMLRKGEGKQPGATDIVRVHYRGKLADGTLFDSSYGKFGQSTYFRLDQLVKGMSEGMQLMHEGGMIELEIPPELGYGEPGNGPVPPNATLHFIVELLEVK